MHPIIYSVVNPSGHLPIHSFIHPSIDSFIQQNVLITFLLYFGPSAIKCSELLKYNFVKQAPFQQRELGGRQCMFGSAIMEIV